MNFWYGKQICVCWTFSVKYYLLVSQANRFNMAFTVGNLFLCHWFDLSQLWTQAAIMRQTTMRKQQSYYSLIESVLVIIPWIIIIIYMQLECSLRCYSDSVITIWFTSPYNGCSLLSEFRKSIETPYSTGSFGGPFHFLFYSRLLLFWFIGLCLWLDLVSHDVLFILNLHIKYTVRMVPLQMYIMCFVTVWLSHL